MNRPKILNLTRAAIPVAKSRGGTISVLVNRSGNVCALGAIGLAAGVPQSAMINRGSLARVYLHRWGLRWGLLELHQGLLLACEAELELEKVLGTSLSEDNDVTENTVSTLRRVYLKARKKWPKSAEKADKLWPSHRKMFVTT